jgi:vitamin K-dependent gamma-carboxylase-like protein
MDAKMAFLRACTRRWNQYWFEPISPYPIAAFRILFGIYLLVYFLSFLPSVDVLFSNVGVTLPFLLPDWTLPGPIAWLVYAVMLLLIGLFIIGYATRVVTPLLLVLFLYYYAMYFGWAHRSFDRINLIFLILLCGADVNAVWSWGSRTGREDRLVAAWATRLIRLEVALIYFGSGIHKLVNPLWHDGQLLQMTYQSEWATPAAFWFVRLGLPQWFFDGLTWGVIAFELAMGPALYSRYTRKWSMLLGLAFHLGTLVLLGIPQFLSCVTSYVLFLPGEEVRRYGEWVSRPWFAVAAKLGHEWQGREDESTDTVAGSRAAGSVDRY